MVFTHFVVEFLLLFGAASSCVSAAFSFSEHFAYCAVMLNGASPWWFALLACSFACLLVRCACLFLLIVCLFVGLVACLFVFVACYAFGCFFHCFCLLV